MKRLLQILNIISLLAAIGASYLLNGRQDTPSVAEISAKYDNLLTPAGYAFGIWGLIYLSLIVFVIYQAGDLFNKNLGRNFVLKMGWWFIIANLANAAWIWAFTSDQPGLSVIIMLVIFISLLKIVLITDMERWDAPNPVIFYLWWPISLYFGWITVALIINISAYLTSLGWTGGAISPEIWAVLILLVAAFVFVAMTWLRNMREYANVGVWGIVAIAVKNWDNHHLVAGTALLAAIFIFINAAIHGYRNQATAPFSRKIPAVLTNNDYGKSEHTIRKKTD